MTDDAMRLHERDIGDAVVIDVVGRMVLSERANDATFRTAVSDLLSAGRTLVIINLEQVTQVDTSGLSALVTAHLSAARQGGRVVLVNPPKRVRELLATTRLSALLDVFDSEQEARNA